MKNRRISHQMDLRPRRHDRHSSWGEVGFTIIEVLVSVAVLGIIVVPMAMAFSAGFRVTETTGASLHTSVNRERLAFRFTSDVASVDATGVSTSPTLTCDTAVGGGGIPVVTLNSTTQVTVDATSTRVTYWVTGSGTDINIERRSCDGARPGQAARNGKSRVLAEKIGYTAAKPEEVVHGPYDGTGFGPPCNEYRCQLEIDGRYRYQVTGQRRAFGAGIPNEVGKIYSSSGTNYNGFNYEHFSIDNKSRSVEIPFKNQLSLPGGLDGPEVLNVHFKVRQMLTGLWLRCPQATSDIYTDCVFDSPTDSPNDNWIVGRFDSVWKLPLPLGPSMVMNAGGEYRVSTQLRTSPTAPPKTYGGAAGFPLWVDFYPDDVIYVAPGGTGDGRSYTSPLGSIDAGLKAAKTLKKAEVLVADGNYFENISISGDSYADNRTIVGRFSVQPAIGANRGTKWLRAGNSTYGTKLIGTANVGLQVVGKKVQRFRQLSINSGAPLVDNQFGQPGSSVFGLVVSSEATVLLENSLVRTSPGGRGGPGAGGVQSKPAGCRGGNGVPNSGGQVNNYVTTRQTPLNAPDDSTCKTGPASRLAGDGGAGGHYECPFFCEGRVGRDGRQGGSGASGGKGGGFGGLFGACGPQQGEVGAAAGPPSPDAAAGGGPGVQMNSWLFTAYTGANGTNGAEGSYGIGGAGAGGGAGTGCVDGQFYGASGGSGGEGGWSGPGGQGGRHGGAAIGLLIDGPKTIVKLLYTDVKSDGGGAGGRGGNGAAGTDGGQGGQAGLNRNDPALFDPDSNGSAAGGNGGSGGSGGGGGGGGQGGISVNILYQNDAPLPIQTGVTQVRPPLAAAGGGGTGGAAGAGGLGGDGGKWSGTFWWFWRAGGEIPPGRDAANGTRGNDGSAGLPLPGDSNCHLAVRAVGQPHVCQQMGTP